jgi:hypothetical protein
MVRNYNCLRKYVVALMTISAIAQPACLLGGEDPLNGAQEGWLSSTWKVINNPYVVMVVGQIVLPVIVNKSDDIYVYYWLTDEQREEALKKRQEEKEERRVLIEMQKTELQFRRDPRWKEYTFAEVLDTERLRQQNLRENEILLARAERENEESEVEHLKKMVHNASSEKRTEMQEKLDAYINKQIEIRLKRATAD